MIIEYLLFDTKELGLVIAQFFFVPYYSLL